jgi:protein TonB
MNGKTERELVYTDTALDRCLVDGDAATNVRDRRRRRRALGISLAIEFVVLALLIIVPLMTSVAQPHFIPVSFVPLAFGASPTHSSSKHPQSGSRHLLGSREHPLTFSPNQTPPPGMQEAKEEEDLPISNTGIIAGLFNSDAVLTPVGRPTDAIVPTPNEKPNLQAKHTVKVSEGLQQAQLISRIQPRYPPLALQMRKEGTVLLHAIISRDGRITELEVVSGSPWFVQAALEAVRQWRYRPTYLGSEPVEVETSITLVFRLSQ